jgi:hypothetical protein
MTRPSNNKPTEAWELNRAWLRGRKQEFERTAYDFPRNGKFDWRYLLNHGDCTPGVAFGAKYWKEKQERSDGYYTYEFISPELAWEVFRAELVNANKLASLITMSQFENALQWTDCEAYDDRVKDYKYEWKLSTVLKNLHRIDG